MKAVVKDVMSAHPVSVSKLTYPVPPTPVAPGPYF